jgi:signal transduction histidine kinase
MRFEMKRCNARLAIPLTLHSDMIGIMLLGKKKSDEDYTQDDLDVLTDLARTESIAIGNAQLFAETAQNERRAAIGTLAAGINHEICNPLNIINMKIQVYLMGLKEGIYKERKPEEIIEEACAIMNVCLKQTSRISDITKKLSSFAKPSKDFKPELTDIEEQIDDTLAVVGHDLELERIEIRKDIRKPLSKILSDKRQIQQVFFNIIRNAGQAIKGKGVIEIRAFDDDEGNVKIEIADTGHGIPEDKIEKIYEPFFTTKDPGEGTGLGLAIVRQLVWRNKGDIKVRSKVDEGTTFIITFPRAI